MDSLRPACGFLDKLCILGASHAQVRCRQYTRISGSFRKAYFIFGPFLDLSACTHHKKRHGF